MSWDYSLCWDNTQRDGESWGRHGMNPQQEMDLKINLLQL